MKISSIAAALLLAGTLAFAQVSKPAFTSDTSKVSEPTAAELKLQLARAQVEIAQLKMQLAQADQQIVQYNNQQAQADLQAAQKAVAEATPKPAETAKK